ncbi:MAG: enoyl-CoA hydratase/isomerase family protein [Candidatus Aminicenantes bacterium]|nr:enoyl-CoA hydratase/isomerase family protein [Candidatus Aminicenantes bacterium]
MARKTYETILSEQKDHVCRITFNRPEIHNAFNAVLIKEVTDALVRAEEDKDIRIVILTGKGKSFCAGADIQWMREIIQYSFGQNLEESLQLAEVLYRIYTLPKPTLAMVNGSAIGGGTGFLSACDISIAAEEAFFGLSEVKIGLVPAAISPYVIRKIGESKAREYFLTGARMSARRAAEIGLINEVVPMKELEGRIDVLVQQLLTSGPEAVANCKELIRSVPSMSFEEAKAYTARMIANLRVSDEGQEGMAAFFEKRKPRWAQESRPKGKKYR